MTSDLISLELYLMVLTLTLNSPNSIKVAPLWSPCSGLVLQPSPLPHPSAGRHDPLTPLLCCTFVPVWIFHIAVAAGAWCRTELSLCTCVWERRYAGPWRVVRQGMRVAADASLPACARLSVSARLCLDTPDRGWNHPHGRSGFISSSSPSFSARTLTLSISVLVSPPVP